MKRALLKQMRREWRDNIWMVLGLAVVAIAVWLITVGLLFTAKALFYPLGADTDNVCSVNIRTIPKESPDYIDRGDEANAAERQDMRALINTIRKSPYVEAAAFSSNALPYNLSYSGTALRLFEEDTIGYHCNVREMSPDMVRVLHIESLTGKSEAELENMLRNDELLVTNLVLENKDIRQPEEYLGKSAWLGGGNPRRVGDMVRMIRRSDYDLGKNGMVLKAIDENGSFDAWEIAIRVKPSMRDKFIEEFESTPSMQKQGNVILYNLEFLNDRAKAKQRGKDTTLRMTISLNVMLVIIVALGIMGVFWFRVQQRVSETAIRKVCGAKNSDIFRRVISEGLILILMAAVLMVAIGWPICKNMFLTEDRTNIADVLISGAATLLFLAIAMVICIWIPARKATKIEPAIAIKDE
ncbi:MAG: FtsX-like permease family protein [Clostridium sp.]|nr:FtsX-like permease family protein [Clostridium sp.]